ncbi:putative mannose-6-phosphate isomerase YvyI [compost metagenome]
MKTDLTETNQWLTLAQSPFFVVEKGQVGPKWKLSTSADSFVILVIADGTGTLEWADGSMNLKPGDCFLLPASLGEYSLEGSLTVIRSYLP